MMRTSVFSDAGAPSMGSCWVKEVNGCTLCQIASFTRPSMTGPSADASSLLAVNVGIGGDCANTEEGMTTAESMKARQRAVHEQPNVLRCICLNDRKLMEIASECT